MYAIKVFNDTSLTITKEQVIETIYDISVIPLDRIDEYYSYNELPEKPEQDTQDIVYVMYRDKNTGELTYEGVIFSLTEKERLKISEDTILELQKQLEYKTQIITTLQEQVSAQNIALAQILGM